MVTIKEKCPECNQEMTVSIGQSDRVEKLVWFRSFRCDHCGISMEEDGVDLPEDLRAIILKNDGTWALSVMSGENRVIVYKVLRKTMGLTMSEIKKIAKDHQEAIITGTHVEMRFLKNRMEKEGLRVQVEKIESPYFPP